VWWVSGGAIATLALLFGILYPTEAPEDAEVSKPILSVPTNPPNTNKQKPMSPDKADVEETRLAVVEALFLYTKLKSDYYLENGKFQEKPSQLIPIHSHYFIVKSLEHGVQISAVPRQKDTYGYVAVLWGGKISTADKKRQANWKPEDPTDIGTLSLPNFSRTPSDYSTRVVYCESLQPVMEPPPRAFVPKSLPISSKELACPNGYAFSLGIIEAIGKLSARTAPATVIPSKPD
ncbi:MAG: hypothetical protein F6K35_27890, partial [Okeania sp. SIO2H7]|nr:hypothetical protein [Okeania sp. SIO2H7]